MLIVLTFGASHVVQPSSNASEPSKAARRREWSGGPYCGIYCLYAALRAVGVSVPFESLVETKYVSTSSGSTLADLQHAAQDSGATAVAIEGLTATALRNAPGPVLLHVRRPGKGMPYLHWVLFLGIEDGKARILDPPNDVALFSFAQLLSLWDGVGLLVAKDAPVSGWMFYATWFQNAASLACVVVLLAACSWVVQRPRVASLVRSSLRRSLGRAAGLFLLAGFAAIGSDLASPNGFLRNPVAIAQVVGRHFVADPPKLALAQIRELLGRPHVTFIDARLPNDYDSGHLPGAVNLPVFAGPVQRDEVLSTIVRDAPIVVYCQSEHCAWGRAIASDLIFRGYKNVAVFPGGWTDFENSKAANTK